MANEVLNTAKEKMTKTMNVMRDEFAALRAGRANPRVLDRILVDYYGTPTPIQQLGNIATPEPRILQISVWDVKAIKDIEKAILKSDLGINPTNDGKVIRLVFPELTEERRKELCKTVRKKAEEGKIAIRAIRRDANEQIKKMEKSSEITEDDRKQMENEVQKLTDSFIKDIDAAAAAKEKEIMEV
ncbi:MAG: ribosome recycling factor [Christensenellales bacterium]|jgi:ribosome recycling factor